MRNTNTTTTPNVKETYTKEFDGHIESTCRLLGIKKRVASFEEVAYVRVSEIQRIIKKAKDER